MYYTRTIKKGLYGYGLVMHKVKKKDGRLNDEKNAIINKDH